MSKIWKLVFLTLLKLCKPSLNRLLQYLQFQEYIIGILYLNLKIHAFSKIVHGTNLLFILFLLRVLNLQRACWKIQLKRGNLQNPNIYFLESLHILIPCGASVTRSHFVWDIFREMVLPNKIKNVPNLKTMLIRTFPWFYRVPQSRLKTKKVPVCLSYDRDRQRYITEIYYNNCLLIEVYY